MARDTYIIRPTVPVRPALPVPTREDKIRVIAQHVLEQVARQIEARRAKPRTF